MAKKYPVFYTILVWIGIAAFGFTTFYGMYILSLLPEIPVSEGEERQMLIEIGATIVAIGTTSLTFLGMSLWRLVVSKVARDKALHYLANQQQYRLRVPDLVQVQLTEVVRGYSGLCDEDAARQGIDWMRNEERAQGKTPMF